MANSTSAEHETRKWIEYAGRLGYATKGIVYLIVGGLAAAAGWGAGGATTGSEGAISTIAKQPFGQTLLWLVAAGLAAYCLWRLVEAVTDPDRKGHDAKGIATRIGYAVSGIAYGFLAWKAAPFSASQPSSGSGSGAKEGLVAQVLAWPFGKWIVGAVGIIVVGYGCYQIYRGIAERFMDKYNQTYMSPKEQKVAKYAGKFGLTARGITFGVIGTFIVVAAVQLNPDQIKGVGEALDVLARQPYGMWVLLAVGIGLAFYGVFCLVQAKYRAFRVGT
jgi:hypothetical protein